MPVRVSDPVRITATSGSVKDYISGVRGTGRGQVIGTTKVKGVPDAAVSRKVRLLREIDGRFMRELWSDPITGAYSFNYVDELQRFTVISYDHTGLHNGVIATGYLPELIP